MRFTGVSTDTRHLTPGALFVALTGERFDAHGFLANAKARGAAAAVVRGGTPSVDGLPFFEVPDTLEALGMLARARRRLLPSHSPVIAITGSSGKTSTKEMIRAALATKWRVHATSANLNNLVGVPLTLLDAPGDAQALVVGFHQIENAMLAVAVAREAGADPARALAALRDVRLPPGRGSVLAVRGLTVIDDTYNANPSSLRWAVRFADWLARRRGRPLAVGVGCLVEFGLESARLHAAAAAEIVALHPALVGAVGAFVPALEAHRAALGGRLVVAADAEALGPALRAALRGDEVVLLKASRGVALERVLRFLN